MIKRAAAFTLVNFGLETVEKPKRKNMKISTNLLNITSMLRRERISENIRS